LSSLDTVPSTRAPSFRASWTPEGWARSQIEEGIDQLARYVFLRQAWKSVVPPEDAGWIDAQIASAKARPSDPGAGAGPALQRLLAAQADRNDIHEVVRVMQWELLFSLCYLLEDPGELEPEIADMSWRLMRTRDDGACVGPISGLHESVLETEPAGREMRPQLR
jgi:hypothetical protein